MRGWKPKMLAVGGMLLLATAALCWMQYRSLVALRGASEAAIRDGMRQLAAASAAEMEQGIRVLAGKVALAVPAGEMDPQRTRDRLTAAQNAHPELLGVTLTADCGATLDLGSRDWTVTGCRRAIAATANGALSLPPAHGMERQHAAAVRLAASQCATCGGHIALAMTFETPRIYGGVEFNHARVTLQPAYVSGLLDSVLRQRRASSGLNVAAMLSNESANLRYASTQGTFDYQWADLEGILKGWRLGLAYTTPLQQIASRQIRKTAAVSLVVLLGFLLAVGMGVHATAQALRAAEAKATFVAAISHEMRTPLALIRLFADTLGSGRVAAQEKRHHYYQVISSECGRLDDLIGGVLNFADWEAGVRRLNPAPIAVEEVVRQTVETYLPQMQQSGFQVTLEATRRLPPVMADADAVRQALLNLLSNAVKFSRQDKRVAVRVRAAGERVLVEVEDAGMGIAKAEQKRIFEKFYRGAEGARHARGSGLGLAVTRHILRAHGGEVRVRSDAGAGAVFVLEFPAGRTAVEVAEHGRAELCGENPGR